MQGNIPWRDLSPTIAGSVGFVLGLLFVSAGYSIRREEKDATYRAPQTIAWMMLTGAQVAFWVIATPRLADIWRELHNYGSGNWVRIATVLLVLFLLIIVPSNFDLRFKFDFRHLGIKLRTMTLIGTLVGVLAITDILLVQASLAKAMAISVPDLNLVQFYLARRGELQQLLTILGGIIGLATLATGALRNATLAAGADKKGYPSESVLLYGLYYTGMVALIYVPVYLSVAHAGEVIGDKLIPLQVLDVNALSGYQEKRKAVEDLLQLHGGAVESLQSGLAILAPLGSSIVAILLSGDK